MTEFLSTLTGLILKGGIVLLAANEVRGLILAAPVLYGLYAAGGTIMAVWIGICSIAGILISIAPLFVAKRLNLLPARPPGRRGARG
jgi:hypothetical protein